jgi:DNA-binding NtrC family response regulator
MALTFEAASRLVESGQFLQLIREAGRSDSQRSLEPSTRVLVANALALAGHGEEADRLAKLDCTDATPAAIRAQAEWTRGLAHWRKAEIAAAIRHARVAVRFAKDSKHSEHIAWAHLHLFRFLIESGPLDAITSALADARRYAAAAGCAQATAYLHNCVAVLEGQTGRFSEASRHLDIAESLLTLAPNAWLLGSSRMHRGSIACSVCDFKTAAIEFAAAKEAAKSSGLHHATAADSCLGYVQLLMGDFDRAIATLKGVLENEGAAIFMKLAAADTLARVHLARAHTQECDDALSLIDRQAQQYPEVVSVFHVRWSAITHARRALKTGDLDYAHKWAEVAIERAELVGDVPLKATANLLLAQIAALLGNRSASADYLTQADSARATRIREMQALFYHTASISIDDSSALAIQLRARSNRIWNHQHVVSVPLEVNANTDNATADSSNDAYDTNAIINALASFSDLAHNPDLLAIELQAVMRTLGCSADTAVVETPIASVPPKTSREEIVLSLGRKQNVLVSFTCRVSEDPAKAIVTADILRTCGAAIELEVAREREGANAALWPAPPIEEQGGALFLADDMKSLLAIARRIAPTNVSVLVTGETGTGKEVVARTIHAYSLRSSASFLPFNCSSVPKDMLDSQLFGHRKGSFTGAVDNFPGVIRAAAGGTLFLDEIGETMLDVQPKLLRFLESGEVHPIGETQPLKSDVRVIAATNADLDKLVADGRFREDLFYRLNIVRLHIPPLRDRRVEIPALAHHYLLKHAQEYRKGNLRLAEETMEYLLLYRWPGNVRQLANEMRRLAALAEADAVLMPEHLSSDIAASRKTIPASERSLEPTEVVVRIDQPMTAAIQHLERAMIQHAMRLTGGRMEETASLLGVSRKGLYLKRVRYGLDEPPETAETVEIA